MATNLYMSGFSMGSIITPMMIHFMIASYGWKWTMRIQAVLLLNVAVLAYLLRLPPNYNKSEDVAKSKSGVGQIWKNCKVTLSMGCSLTFIIVSVSYLLSMFSLTTMFVHTAVRARSLGIDATWSSFMMTIIAFFCFGTR
jgi:MFS family permease